MSTVSTIRREFLARWRQFLREIDPVAVQLPMEGLEREFVPAVAERAPLPEPSRTEPQRGPEPGPTAPPAKRMHPRTLREDLLDRQTLRRAIVLREILDRPLALRVSRRN